jgi:hypothetical protein
MGSPNRQGIVHSQERLQLASDYLEYHVRMYVETLRFLRGRIAQRVPKDIIWNSVLEAHLIHARVLIDFLGKDSGRDDDVLAIDFFHDAPGVFEPPRDEFLKTWADNVGGRLVHITTKPMPALKSEQDWPIEEIAFRLAPPLEACLAVLPENQLAEGVRAQTASHLSRLTTVNPLHDA